MNITVELSEAEIHKAIKEAAEKKSGLKFHDHLKPTYVLKEVSRFSYLKRMSFPLAKVLIVGYWV